LQGIFRGRKEQKIWERLTTDFSGFPPEFIP